MITAERKPIEEIIGYINPYKRILLVGCNECVTVCAAGGRKEVGMLSSAIQMAFMQTGKMIEIKELTLERQCDRPFSLRSAWPRYLSPHVAGRIVRPQNPPGRVAMKSLSASAALNFWSP